MAASSKAGIMAGGGRHVLEAAEYPPMHALRHSSSVSSAMEQLPLSIAMSAACAFFTAKGWMLG